MKKIFSLLILFVLITLAACGNTADDAPQAGGDATGDGDATAGETSGTDISILFGKPEIAREFENAVKEFSDETGINVTVIPLAGGNAFERMTSLYSSGNAPTIMNMAQEFDAFKDRLLPLTDQPWVGTVQEGMLDFVTVDDEIYGQPMGVEAFGFIYNKEVLDEAVGGDFDPANINTIDEFRNLLEQIDALEGVDAIHVSPMDWSLGAHLTNPFFASQSEERDERHQFMQDMLDGNVSLGDNEVFNGWLTTFNLMKEFNQASNSPLAPQYDDGAFAVAAGQTGLWFMGNWAYPQLHEINPDGEFGFLPVPVGNDPDQFGNNEISVGVPSYWVVDGSQSTEQQQEAAKQFLTWLVGSEAGQEHYVENLKLIPVFDNFTVKPEDSLSLSVLSYMDGNNTLEWMNSYYPTDAWPSMGATLQKYISDNIDKDVLIQEFEEYWENASK